ncbi:glycoside hydrolase domain-containing protein [Kribbella sp. DT2]|uniref:glycoside hydrolase domain-containing protein n=1 Tax=Kribbella sp. DT2 TaxID=3393427 RepID=UPI003CF24F7E
MVHLEMDLRRTYGEDYLVHGVAHPISHTLDLAYACQCTAAIAEKVRDRPLAQQMREHAQGRRAAYDPGTGLLRDSTFYEGGRWNYSFRLLHDMRARIALAGGDEAFVDLLDRFFEYDAVPVTGRGGLPGNDDSGGLSAWYVWAALGLFPVAGRNLFLVSAPAVAGGPVSYVQSVAVNGKTLERPWISGRELRHLRNLHIELGPRPSDWGTRIRPPSTSDTTGGEA